jgi:hypothetical protein
VESLAKARKRHERTVSGLEELAGLEDATEEVVEFVAAHVDGDGVVADVAVVVVVAAHEASCACFECIRRRVGVCRLSTSSCSSLLTGYDSEVTQTRS